MIDTNESFSKLMYSQIAEYLYSWEWLLEDIYKSGIVFTNQNYLNIAYGLEISKDLTFDNPPKDIDIINLWNRNLFRNIIFEYLDVYFGENNRKFNDIIIMYHPSIQIQIKANSDFNKIKIEEALNKILPEWEDYIIID